MFQHLRQRFGEEKILEHVQTGDEKDGWKDAYILVKNEALVEVCRHLRNDPDLVFDMLHCVSGVDYKEYIESVYHLWSTSKRHWGILKVRVPRDHPTVPSVVSIWKSADWLERETYDLMGIVYEGHPDLKRILLPEEWEGHPLRKDYKAPSHEALRAKGF